MTSEGIRAEVIRVDPELVRDVLGEEPSPTADPTPTDGAEPAGGDQTEDRDGGKDGVKDSDSGTGGSVGPVALVVLAVAAYFIFRKRS